MQGEISRSDDAMQVRVGTMGMFIIDTFQYFNEETGEDLGNKGLDDQIGGGGCYFAIGARMWLPPYAVQMIIDRGSDWRSAWQEVLDRFDMTPAAADTRSMWHYRSRPDGTTRAVNIYRGDNRGFDYLSPKIRLEPPDLLSASPCSPPTLPKWLHLICSPDRAIETLAQIDRAMREARDAGRIHLVPPRLVYEPIPDSCIFANLHACMTVLPRLAVFSPNHEEAASLLGLTDEWQAVVTTAKRDQSGASSSHILDFIEHKLARKFVHLFLEQSHADESDPSGKGSRPSGPVICIRSGAWGSVVGRAGLEFFRVPAWHSTNPVRTQLPDCSADKIRDVTGAGNSFLGGFTAHLSKEAGDNFDSLSPASQQKAMIRAAMYGSVSASLVIEQLGLPDFEVRNGAELWNGARISDRLQVLENRMASIAS
ncbi:Ribokinase-like protein [Testicularia cyperi]|uniref:Ribokinase-like protein n=1 Tax=Testicularia cyperi TaxID=1882483 RepID=A0A317XPP6_9BASI|nr:Ribokinase-like protein [Testicularia cyperi]